MADDSLSDPQPAFVAISLAEAEKQLHAFLQNNPSANLEEHKDSKGVSIIRILQPWGDKSLAISLRKDIASLASALNSIYLPARLSGVYHSDLRAIEITFTAFSLSGEMQEVGARDFNFVHDSISHQCKFFDSSDRLLVIAANATPLTSSLTSFRNLQSYIIYGSIRPEDRTQFNLSSPLSFWIYNVDWDEEKCIELINALNFYMSYFDSKTPLVLVHNVTDVGSDIKDKDRYAYGSFPAEIRSTVLDQNLISFWNAAHESNPLLSFILYYRIIEYSQFHYMDQRTKNVITRIMSAPNLTSNIQAAVEKISETIQVKSLEEIQKFRMTIIENVDPDLIWSQVEVNRIYFERDNLFEGGFKVEALITKKDDKETFKANGLERFISRIRKIRNTLSHGKDQETAGVIVPTSHNLQMLTPWVSLVCIAAGQIVLYRNNT